MDIVLLLIRLFLFAVFVVAGVAKLFNLKGSEKAVRDFGVPEDIAKPAAVILPVVEIMIAVALLPVTTSWFGATAALLLLLVFTGGMLCQIAQGNAPDCHCFGQLHSEPVGKKSLIRNIGFGLLALFLAVNGPARQGLSLADDETRTIQTMLSLGTVGMLIAVIFYLRKITAQQADILRRIELMGFAADIDPVERNDAGDPNDGLPIGAPMPDWAIYDLDWKKVHFDEILAERKPMLFFFVGANCDPCEALLPEFEEWTADLGDKLNVIFISSGNVQKNIEKFSHLKARAILVEIGRELALTVNAKWTPTALYVDANGNIASHIAAGDSAIRKLVDQIKNADLNKPFSYFLGQNGHSKPKIGQQIPEFTMRDLTSREITSEDFRGRKTIAAFTSLTCSHCEKLIDQIREWEAEKNGNGPDFVIFSEGDPVEHEKYELQTPIILEKGYTTAKKIGMFGVPSAVLIDENGVIVSEAAVGPTNIWALIGKRM